MKTKEQKIQEIKKMTIQEFNKAYIPLTDYVIGLGFETSTWARQKISRVKKSENREIGITGSETGIAGMIPTVIFIDQEEQAWVKKTMNEKFQVGRKRKEGAKE